MGQTLIEKIIASHATGPVRPGEIVDVEIDVRAARDFGGANVVKNLQAAGLAVDDPARTVFTFDCNPGGSDQGYAANQQFCRTYARETGVALRDIDQGIGTHVAIDDGLVGPGAPSSRPTATPTSWAPSAPSARAWATRTSPPPGPTARSGSRCRPRRRSSCAAARPRRHGQGHHPEDGRRAGRGGPAGLRGRDSTATASTTLTVADRVTIASMATEMGGIIMLFPPNQAVLDFCAAASRTSLGAGAGRPGRRVRRDHRDRHRRASSRWPPARATRTTRWRWREVAGRGSTRCSSAAAPTAASTTCAPRPRPARRSAWRRAWC